MAHGDFTAEILKALAEDYDTGGFKHEVSGFKPRISEGPAKNR